MKKFYTQKFLVCFIRSVLEEKSEELLIFCHRYHIYTFTVVVNLMYSYLDYIEPDGKMGINVMMKVK